jgi:DNA transposition AAA+ family ATPase
MPLKSRDTLAILGICDHSQQQRKLDVIVGRSGYGKTYTLKAYAENTKRVAYIECDATMGCVDLVEALARALNLKLVSGGLYAKVNAIRSYLNAYKGHLLIVDEADKLISKQTQKKMEILRGIFDQSEVGLVIAGEERLEVDLGTYLARMANRVSYCITLQG